jgi:dienelactone hydrolase
MSDCMIAGRKLPSHHAGWVKAIVTALLCLLFVAPAWAQSSQPRTVSFPSADGKTTLTGYLFPPAGRPKTAPAIVLLHGRAGVYVASARGEYSSLTLARGIRSWANFLSGDGYWVLVVDSFGPRGFPGGLDTSHATPIDEPAVRPLDAYGALRYLRASPRVRADRIAVEGWSTGADAVLEALSKQAIPPSMADGNHGFRVGIAISPNCALLARLKMPYLTYAPVNIFLGGHGNESAAAVCTKIAAASKAAGADLPVAVYPGATEDFDENNHDRATAAANAAAIAEVRHAVEALFASALGK